LSEVDLGAAGLPGVKYVYSGVLRRLETKDGKIIKLKAVPWNLKDKDIIDISMAINCPILQLESAFIKLHDAFEEATPAKKRGTRDAKTGQSWEDALKYDAKGYPAGLNASVIARLISGDCVRIEDMVFIVENNIGTILTKDALKVKILDGLKSIDAEDFYAMNTYQLVRDQLLPLIPTKKLGSSSGFLPMKNGVLDIEAGKLVSTNDIYTRTTNIDFDPSATECPKITKMLDNMFLPEQKELVLSVIGAAISGKRAPFILALSGAGRNGKSLFRELLEALMMEMITTEKLENLNTTFVNEVFMGKRISWQTEVSSKRTFVEQIKDITGGTTIQIRKKFVDGTLQYPLQMVAIIDTNNPPHFDDSQAINDRVRFINMPHKFVYELTGAANEVLIDPSLVNGWEDELPAFFNMLLPYAQHFIRNGRLKYDINGTVSQLRERSNLVDSFMEVCCDSSNYNASIDLRTLHKYFIKYAETKNVAASDIGQFRYKLKNDFNLSIRGYTVYGVTLRRDETFVMA
jgi:phage/plasmid-associated DNA primase